MLATIGWPSTIASPFGKIIGQRYDDSSVTSWLLTITSLLPGSPSIDTTRIEPFGPFPRLSTHKAPAR